MTNRTDFKVVGALVALALAVGGAGLSFPRLGMLLQFGALAAAAYFIGTARVWRFPRLSWIALGTLGVMFVLLLLQLIPLPPALWTTLPGRELPAKLDAFLGVAQWRPLSLDIEGTLRSIGPLVPGTVVFVGALFLPRGERIQLLWVVLAFGLLGALLGIVQIATGGWATPYVSGHTGDATGLFVNRNHNAAMLLVSMPIAASLFATRITFGRTQAPWIVASVSTIVILAIGVLGTTSRMGLLLLPVAIALALALLFYGRARSHLLLAAVAGVAVVTTTLVASGRFDRILARFAGMDDPRLDYWTDLRWALDYYGLVGTGFGTFVPVFKSAESLEAVVARVTNHAHNDYLEILLEGGLPAAFLLLAFVCLLAGTVFSGRKATLRREHALPFSAALIGIGLLLMASLVDYPLRMPALSAVLALLVAILLPSRRVSTSKALAVTADEGRSRLRPGSVMVALAVLVPAGLLAIQAGLSAHYLRIGNEVAASQWARWSTEAHERLATDALRRGDAGPALSHGVAAIRLSPISAPAVRTLGLVRLSQGANLQGNSLMSIAVVLGWRDPYTQLWAIDAANQSNEPEKALQRAEALFRRKTFMAPAMTQIIGSAPNSRTLPMLAQKLSLRPEWRSSFFDASAQLPTGSVEPWLNLVAMLRRTDAPVSMREGRPFLNALVSQGRTDAAQQLWGLLRSGSGFISNGEFEGIDLRQQQGTPTDWDVPAKSRHAIRVEPVGADGDQRALHVRADRNRSILQQTLMLKPGTYEFSYRGRSGASAPANLRWQLYCGTSGSPHWEHAARILPLAWQEFSAVLTVPVRDCQIQKLALRSSGAMPAGGFWVDGVRIVSGRR